MLNLALLKSEIVLGALALGLLAADLLLPEGRKRALYGLALLACGISLFLTGSALLPAPGVFGAGVPLPLPTGGGPAAALGAGVGTLWSVDPFSLFLKMVVLGSTVLALLLTMDDSSIPDSEAGSFSCLLLLSAVGMMLLVSATDLLLIFVSLELVSIASFILVGYERRNPKSNEGSLKYFIFGAFSSAVMAYGISLFYGATGATSLVAAKPQGAMALMGLLFILVGFGFKAAIAPMHFWVPDAYEGAPTPVTAYLSVAPKLAAMGALARLLTALVPAGSMDLTLLLSLLCGLTMTWGNLVALFQRNIKRLLAYSSIAQAGYIMMGIVTGDAMGLQGILIYSFVYVAMNIGAFALAVALAADRSDALDPYDLDSFDGLSSRSLPAALAMTLFLLSLAGIPPLAGFIGKFYLIGSAVGTAHYGLAIVAVLNSVVSVYYYMSVCYRMFFTAPRKGARVPRFGAGIYAAAALALAVTLFFGVFPHRLAVWAQFSAKFLP
ncbi:MAG: NADH-quinone oxidoreductase subunit N [Elusimicrobia bacterium]|nr:NADH-quinone oxidoreductase subunit N [Elusimicrobiota bacterium]